MKACQHQLLDKSLLRPAEPDISILVSQLVLMIHTGCHDANPLVVGGVESLYVPDNLN